MNHVVSKNNLRPNFGQKFRKNGVIGRYLVLYPYFWKKKSNNFHRSHPIEDVDDPRVAVINQVTGETLQGDRAPRRSQLDAFLEANEGWAVKDEEKADDNISDTEEEKELKKTHVKADVEDEYLTPADAAAAAGERHDFKIVNYFEPNFSFFLNKNEDFWPKVRALTKTKFRGTHTFYRGGRLQGLARGQARNRFFAKMDRPG